MLETKTVTNGPIAKQLQSDCHSTLPWFYLCLVRSYECVFDILRYPVTVIIAKITFEFLIRAGASLLVGVALLIAACSRPGSTAGSSALKPIDQAALQTMVDTTAKELLIPGAVAARCRASTPSWVTTP